MARRRGFFEQGSQASDELARERDVEALLQPRRTVVQDLPLDRVRPNPFQARKSFEQLEELADAMRAQGFTSRLRVRPDPEAAGYFQLVYGERRLRAASLAGIRTVPCEVAEHTDDEMIEIGLAENIQRQDLSPLEEAHAFRLFIDQRGYSIRRLATRIGKHKNYVDDRLALLRAPQDVQAMVEARPDALRAAREISKLDSRAARAPLIEAVVGGELNVHEVRSIVREAASPAKKSRRATQATSAHATRDVGRTLARDLRTCRTILGRWQALVPELGEEERSLLLQAVEALESEMAALRSVVD